MTLENSQQASSMILAANQAVTTDGSKTSRVVTIGHGTTPEHRAQRALRFLVDASAALSSSLEYRQVLQTLSQLAAETVAEFCTCAILQDGMVEIVARAARGQGLLEHPTIRYSLSTLNPAHPVAQALQEQRSTILDQVSPEWIRSVCVNAEQEALLHALDLGAFVIAPMVARSRVFGVFALGYSRLTAEAPAADDLDFAVDLGRRAAMAIDNALLHEAVAASEAHHRALSDTVPQLVWTCKPDGACEYLNRQWLEYTGATMEQHLGWNWPEALHPDDRERALAAWRKTSAEEADYDIEYRMRRFDGAYSWFKARAVPVRDAQGRLIRWVGTTTDIDDQKHAQRAEQEARAEAEAAAAALSAANEELQHFVYAASHDLKAPLRTMSLYSQLLQRQLNGNGNDAALELLRYIIAGSKRLNQLLDDLLAYAKIGTTAIALDERAGLQTVCSGVIAGLQASIAECNAEIICDPLPTLRGSAWQLGEVLQNLISNAIKYRKQDELLRITIRVTRKPEHFLFTVEDNGQGFEPQYAETVFEMFKRLHGDEIEGTGIGLALCRRVIERHGGKIWAASQPGVGSRFYFTIPV